MSQIVVIGFDSETDARDAMRSLRDVEKRGGIAFEDTAIVVHHADGRMEVKNEASSATEGGAIVGGMLGGLLFIMFPVAGIALGALAGAGVGAAFGTGIDGNFVKDVKAALPPGKSALFVVIKQGNADHIVAALRRYQGEIIQTSLDEETETSLRAALSDKG